jgi:hypothetical protein
MSNQFSSKVCLQELIGQFNCVQNINFDYTGINC